jgi:hypothetical protein
MSKHICQNCGVFVDEWEIKPIRDLEQRVSPGEEMPSGECPDCGALCHPYRAKFNHAFTMAFAVSSEHENDEEVTERELLGGILRRVADLVENPKEVLEACGAAFDTYQEEPVCKFCQGEANPKTAHLHQGELVCDSCWDERLAVTA